MTVKNSKEKTVLITGAAGALGAALSRACSAMDYNTIMLDRNLKGLESVWDGIAGAGLKEPFLHPLDLASSGPDQFEELLTGIESEFGGLDGVVHCAASFKGLRPLDQIPPQLWLEQIQVNLNAAWLLSVSCLPLLRRSSISFMYFLLDDLEIMKNGYWGAYGVSKQALYTLVHQFSSECETSSVRIRGINSGPFASPLRAEAYHTENPQSLVDPSIVARKICDLMAGEPKIADLIINLQHA
jgi:NAD(P)-dependent dehydrogenase (short-subunit alcohol dehydrogenase family)